MNKTEIIGELATRTNLTQSHSVENGENEL